MNRAPALGTGVIVLKKTKKKKKKHKTGCLCSAYILERETIVFPGLFIMQKLSQYLGDIRGDLVHYSSPWVAPLTPLPAGGPSFCVSAASIRGATSMAPHQVHPSYPSPPYLSPVNLTHSSQLWPEGLRL